MPGGLLQLVAFGAQNLYLNGNPSLSFFKKVYKTHTNFACESMRINFNKNEASFNEKTHFITRIDRNADLVNDIYFVFTLPQIKKRVVAGQPHKKFSLVDNLGEAFIDEYWLNIGGNVVDRQYGEWLHIWNELSMPPSKRYGYDKMIGNTVELHRPDNNTINQYEHGEVQIPSQKIIVPLMFWFNKHPGLALPLIALQYHEVEINVIVKSFQEIMLEDKSIISDYSLYLDSEKINIDPYIECNYIFLDTKERTFFAKNSLDYLIEKLVRIPFYNLDNNNILDLILQNPVKEIIWILKRNDVSDNNKWFKFGDDAYVVRNGYKSKEILNTAKITFNGLDRIEDKEAAFFNLIQPYQHHTSVPKDGIYVYSFSLNPEKFQPSGSCNMSRLNNIQLHLNLIPPSEVNYKYDAVVYVTSYNFLRVTSGLAGIAFSC
jgi:hypothetical protein